MKRLSQATLSLAAGFALASCEVEQTEEGELPDVDVDVKEGNLPKYDVDGPDVDVDMKKKEIEVPVPDVDVTLPEDNDDGDPNR